MRRIMNTKKRYIWERFCFCKMEHDTRRKIKINLVEMWTWNDFMNVHNKVLIPSPWLRSFTSLKARNKRKKLNLITAPLFKATNKNKYNFFQSSNLEKLFLSYLKLLIKKNWRVALSVESSACNLDVSLSTLVFGNSRNW